ncbi:uncharacterized protein LOC120071167 [Benincasa hispida]|uniref:uncharacterized protein LOC120071167 n=1 Tax=Benincasa hispida TaxID=102211 RepID=UPI0018FF3F59|nr:uncharacterized protein LOC120071167 [Benincasa hispida]
MCPLRFILIFLSATLAGFFLLRNLKSPPQDFVAGDNSDDNSKELNSDSSSSSEVLVIVLHRNLAFPFSLFVSEWNDCGMFEQVSSGFWTVVDMASGRYLWRHLFPSSKKPSD